MEAERARLMLKGKGLRMVNQNLDKYVTKFEKLSRQAGYSTLMDTDLVLDLFTSRIPRALYETAYTLDSPRTFDQWKRALTKQQEKWMHMRRNLDSFRPQTNPSRSHYMPQSSNFTRHHDAMDTTANRTCSQPTVARLAHAEEELAGSQALRPPFWARGGIPPCITPRGACFSCGQQGHFA